jgi:spore germination cell wall hydrolase CwlJ-like protein
MKEWLQKIYDANLRDFGHLPDDQIMALTIYAEARGEIRQGKVAVGSVILERVDHRSWDGTTIKEVCLWPVQFSCYLPKDPNRPMLKDIADHWDEEIKKNPVLQECFEIAQDLISGKLERYPKALDYFNPKVCHPKWADTKTLVAQIGNHLFYI